MNSPESQHGVLVEVCFLDGKPGESIFVKLLSPRFYPDLRRASTDEARLAEIFTGRDAAYIDSLHPDSVEALIVAAWSLNRSHFNRNGSRILENTAEQAGHIVEMLELLSPQVQALIPEGIVRWRELAKAKLKSGLPHDEFIDQQIQKTNPIELNA